MINLQVGNLGAGVLDFFYEPAKGLVSSPQDFGRGLARGTTSLLKHTLSGIFGAASKVTGKLAEGIAVLGMDDEFQQRARIEARKPPKHIGEGLLEGGKSIAYGLYRGVTGIVTDPYHGYRLQGWKGFGKGIFSGILGVGLKPVAGTVAATSKILRGIGNTATCCDDVFENERARFPRFIHSDRIIRPYNVLDATMAACLKLYPIEDLGISKKEKSEETYLKMYETVTGEFVVLSNIRLILMPPNISNATLTSEKELQIERKRRKPRFILLWEDVQGFQHFANTVVVQMEAKRKPKQFKLATEFDAKECVISLRQMLVEHGKNRRGKFAGAVSDAVRKTFRRK